MVINIRLPALSRLYRIIFPNTLRIYQCPFFSATRRAAPEGLEKSGISRPEQLPKLTIRLGCSTCRTTNNAPQNPKPLNTITKKKMHFKQNIAHSYPQCKLFNEICPTCIHLGHKCIHFGQKCVHLGQTAYPFWSKVHPFGPKCGTSASI